MKREEKLKTLIINAVNFQSETVTDEYLENVVKTYVPKKLYKYKKIDKYCFNQIKEQYAWFSKFSDVDDQLEYTVNYDSKVFQEKLGEVLDENIEYLLQELMEKKSNIKTNVNAIRAIKDEYLRTSEQNQKPKGQTKLENILLDKLKDVREKNKVFCLSEDYDNDAMWSLYAGGHKGFCIEYNIEKVFEQNYNSSMLYYLWPVIYKKNKTFDMFEFFKPILQNIFNIPITEELNKEQQILLNQNLFTKSYSWRWQNEWRFFLNEVDNKVDFPLISAIYIGDKMSEYNKKRILNISQKYKYKVYQQQINRIGSDYEYKLIYEP